MEEYNPLDYKNLTQSIVRELFQQSLEQLEHLEEFLGAGIYALFYQGDFDVYRSIFQHRPSMPIYVGKAVPPGARKGGIDDGKSKALFNRLKQHSRSIKHTVNLDLSDFSVRYLVVTPLWITMAERLLIQRYRPVWNVCIEGFGLHNPGKGRFAGEISWWDAIHPGRPWARRLKQTRSAQDVRDRLAVHLEKEREMLDSYL